MAQWLGRPRAKNKRKRDMVKFGGLDMTDEGNVVRLQTPILSQRLIPPTMREFSPNSQPREAGLKLVVPHERDGARPVFRALARKWW
jgi:hypothetical protein